MTKKEFLDYTALDEVQAEIILEKINFISKAYQAGLFRTRREMVLEPPLPAEKVEEWESEHSVKLPEEYKWFITKIGRRFCPCDGSYNLLDISNNEDYIHNFEDCEVVGERTFGSWRKLDLTLFVVAFNGCSSFWALGTHEWDYGKIFEANFDYISEDINFVEDEEEYEEKMKEISEISRPERENFLIFFKSGLYDMWEEVQTATENGKTAVLKW